ncbi:N-acetylglucosamine kinase [Bacillus sp. AK128]
MRYVMGVDGGGSKTFTVICDEDGNRVGQGVSGHGNHQLNGIESAIRNIKDSINQALHSANLDYRDISFVLYGLAGADREKDFSILRPALSRLPFDNWEVVCDTMEGLRTGSSNNVGVVLVCGSGTNAAGRNEQGDVIQTGGFGYFYGDGIGVGGYELAKETFRMAVRSWELREPASVLPAMVSKHLGYESMEEVFHDYLDKDINTVPSSLAIVLHQAADCGDQLAISLLERVGKELGLAANSVIKRLGGIETTPIPIVLVGSVVQKGKNEHLLRLLRSTMEQENPRIDIIIPKMEPVYGAIMLAMDHLNLPVTQEMQDKFIQYGGYDTKK